MSDGQAAAATGDNGTTTATAATAATTTTTIVAPWYNGETDQEFIGKIQNMGLDKKTPVEAAKEFYKSHREAQQMISRLTGTPDKDRIIITPKPDASQADKDAFYQRLGRPAKPEEYDFTSLKWADGEDIGDQLSAMLRASAFKANATKEQAATMAKDFIDFMDKSDQADTAQAAAKQTAEKAELDKNWGANKETNLFIARQGMAKLGFTGEQIQAMEQSAGYKAIMEAGLKAGLAFGEDKYIANKGANSGVLTVEGAKARMAERRQDAQWAQRAAVKGTNENLEWEALIVAMTPNPGG